MAAYARYMQADEIDTLWKHIVKLSNLNSDKKASKDAVLAEYNAYHETEEVFKELTKDHQGIISENTFSNPPSELAMHLAGDSSIDQQAAVELFRQIDIGNHSYLNFPDFYKTYRGLLVQELKFEAVWTELAGSDGQTTVQDALPLLVAIEDGMSLQDAEDFIQSHYNPDDDGTIYKDEAKEQA